MALVLPSTVEELNNLHSAQQSPGLPNNYMYVTETNKDFENIVVEKRYKREVSLPNGVQNWNISDFDSYLNFEHNLQPSTIGTIAESPEQLVPVPDNVEFRQRSESLSSVSSSMDEKFPVYHNMGVKTFSTVCMDSGSTCISSEHNYVSPSPTLFKELEPEEVYQNLDTFLSQRPDVHPLDTISSSSSSSVGSPLNDSNLEYSVLSNSLSNSCSQDSFSEKPISLKRSSNFLNDESFLNPAKRACDSPSSSNYTEVRKKNNIASKNCRKTRKEKQKEMEIRVLELEKERDELNTTIRELEKMISIANAQFNSFCRGGNGMSRINVSF